MLCKDKVATVDEVVARGGGDPVLRMVVVDLQRMLVLQEQYFPVADIMRVPLKVTTVPQIGAGGKGGHGSEVMTMAWVRKWRGQESQIVRG